MLAGSRGFAVSKKDTVRYDSSVVKLATPSKVIEQEIFSDSAMQYDATKAQSANWFDRFVKWLLEQLFGHDNSATREKLWRIIAWICAAIDVILIAWMLLRSNLAGAAKVIVWSLLLVCIGLIARMTAKSGTSDVISMAIWGFALTGVALIILLLLRSEFTGIVMGTARASQFNFSDIGEDISGINFTERIRKAFEEGDYRLAIRWQYLRQLFQLNEKGLIAWRSNKTNIDYAAELSKTALQKHFNRLSYVYEYVWYGKYEISRDKYLEFENEFNRFETSIG